MRNVTLLKFGLILLVGVVICDHFFFQDRIHRNSSRVGVHQVDMVMPIKAIGPKKDWVFRQWRLEVPNAYIGNWSGRGGKGKRYSEEYFWMDIQAKINPETKEILP